MSTAPYRQIETEQHGDVYCLGLRDPRLRFTELDELIAELDRFVAESQCRKLVFLLGPEEPQCLYSLFLAKLVSLQRRLQAKGVQDRFQTRRRWNRMGRLDDGLRCKRGHPIPNRDRKTG